MTLREVIRKVFNKTINEKMTKEQQDAGREAMERIYLKPMFQLVDWFNNYCKNKSKTMEYFKQIEKDYREGTKKYSKRLGEKSNEE